MNDQSKYAINLDVKFNPLELVDVQTLVDECADDWYNQSLCQVNDCVVRLGIMQGEWLLLLMGKKMILSKRSNTW